MAVTAASLRVAFPEFTSTPDALVNSAISRALLFVNDEVFEDEYDDAVTLYACHLILIAPSSVDLRIAQAQRGSTSDEYLAAFNELAFAAGTADRVLP